MPEDPGENELRRSSRSNRSEGTENSTFPHLPSLAAHRHGGIDRVDVSATGPELTIGPITPASAPVVLGEDLRDLGAAVAALLVRALGGSVSVEDETLHVRLPE